MKLATLCYVGKDTQTLMVNVQKEGFNKGKWNGLGGKIDVGETPEQCVIREVKEESGLEISNPKLCGLLHFPADTVANEDWHVYVFTCNEFAGELINDSAEGKLEWIDNDKLLDLKLNACDYIFFPWMWDGKIFESTFITEGVASDTKFYESAQELNITSL